jgi:hypothetical protein
VLRQQPEILVFDRVFFVEFEATMSRFSSSPAFANICDVSMYRFSATLASASSFRDQKSRTGFTFPALLKSIRWEMSGV